MDKTNIEDCQREVENAMKIARDNITNSQASLGILEAFLYLIRKETTAKINDLTVRVKELEKSPETQG